MRNSKRSTLQILLSFVSLILLVFVLCYVIGKTIKPVSYADFFNHDTKLIEQNNEKVEMIMFGDSKIYSSMDARVLEEKLAYNNVIIASTSAQPISGTYYLMDDMIKRFSPEKVVLNVDYSTLIEDSRLQSLLLCADRLTFKNKLHMFTDYFYPTDWLYLLDIYRYRDYLDDVFKTIKERNKLIENNYIDDHSNEEHYVYKGFISRNLSVATGNVPMLHHDEYSEDMYLDENVEYLYKCLDLCKENNIDLILIDAPTTLMRMFYVDNHDKAIEDIRNIADTYNIPFFELNYLKNREEVLPDEMMMDYNHTNSEGAKVISEIFADIIKKYDEGKDVSDYFYKNYNEFSESIERIAGVGCDYQIESDNLIMELKSAHPDHLDPIYKVEYLDNSNNYKTLVDWTKETSLTVKLPNDYSDTIKVIAATDQNDDKYAYQIYTTSE